MTDRSGRVLLYSGRRGRSGTAAVSLYIGGVTPFSPAEMNSGDNAPSGPFFANSTTCAPGTSSERSPASRLTTGTSSGTTTFFSPFLYFTVIVRPLETTRSPTVPLFIQLFLRGSH